MERIPFDGIPFDTLANEADVREVVCHPLLRALGFDETEICRNPTLQLPYMLAGSGNRRIPITFRPDYLAYRRARSLLVLDAKAPSESVDNPRHVQQAYGYAVHPDVRAPLYALCNGKELAVWRTTDPPNSPAIRMDLSLWSLHAGDVHGLLAQYESEPSVLSARRAVPFDYRAIGLPNPSALSGSRPNATTACMATSPANPTPWCVGTSSISPSQAT